MHPAFYIRPARVEEAAALSDLCFRSKAVWGYDPEFMALMLAALGVAGEDIAAGDVGRDRGRRAGVVALAPGDAPGALDLNKLFIEPRHIRSGVGRALLAHAIAEARRRGAGRLTILADPNAAAWLRSRQLPGETARQLPDLSTIIRVEPSHTDDSRLQGALPTADVPILKLHEKSELVGCAP